MTEGFQPPLRATGHCRHYSYDPKGFGEACALGVDVADAGAWRRCMPYDFTYISLEPCALRADYTADERAAWEGWEQARLKRMEDAIAALPAPLPIACVGHVDCPSCGGLLRWGRWYLGASIRCETPYCVDARFEVAIGTDWPTAKQGA